jgi:K+-sensing histidine kinase KdpD
MRKLHLTFNRSMVRGMSLAALTVFGVTGLLLLIGRATLGEAVIALLYVVPVGWVTSRWGQWPGIAAAVTAALCFDFFFIPPFLTFTVGGLEGWLVLAIFLAVALVVVGRIQLGLALAQASEREAIMMYELSAALAGVRTQAAVAYAMAQQLQLMLQAELVRVVLPAGGLAAQAPLGLAPTGRPARLLPILTAWGLAGEIQIWPGAVMLPAEDGRLFRNFVSQAAQALERTRLAEADQRLNSVSAPAHVN